MSTSWKDRKTLRIKNTDQANFLKDNGAILSTSPFGKEKSFYKDKNLLKVYIEFICNNRLFELMDEWNNRAHKK